MNRLLGLVVSLFSLVPASVSSTYSFDLGSAELLQELRISFSPGVLGPFDIQISEDGSTWTQVMTGAQGSGEGEQSFDIPDTHGRFVRLVAKSATLDGLPAYANVQVLGASPSLPDAGVPDGGTVDPGVPDAGAPDAGLPDSGIPDAGSSTPPPPSKFVYLKLDDLTNYPPRVQAFQRAMALIQAKGVRASFAMVGGGLADNTGGRGAALCNAIRAFNDSGRVEVIHHGGDHGDLGGGKYEFYGMPLDYQAQHLQQSLSLAQKCGVTLKTFNAPFNLSDAATVSILEQTPQIRTWVFPGTVTGSTKTLLKTQDCRLDIERTTGVIDEAGFRTNWQKAASKPCAVLQGHPGAWTEESWTAFGRIVDFLQTQNVAFKLPAEAAP